MDGTKIAVIVFICFASAQRVLETFARRPKEAGPRQMMWSFYAFVLLHAVIFGGALVEFLWAGRTLVWPVSVAGLVLFGFSLWLRNAAIRALGRFWSLVVEIREKHQFVQDGPYRYVRHPAYAAIVLEVLCVPMVANAWWAMLFAALTYVPLLVWRLKVEEKALVEKFGEPYRQFQREVGALVPRCRCCCKPKA
jgi:protein-S-isoprenylcysteine O-methyltransferase Ste14